MTEREHVGIAVLALGAIGAAAGLEGGYEPRVGAVAYVLLGCAAAWALTRGDVPSLSRPVRIAVGVLIAVVLVQVVPLPPALRGVVAPGLADRLDWAAGTATVPRPEWLAALSKFDLDVLLGTAGTYDFDPLAGASDDAWRPLALSPAGWAWRGGQWAASAGAILVGWRVSRSRPALLVFLLGLLGMALLEAFFGFANRNGPSTGIGKKVSYLGYATGTFVNRGHFAAFLVMGIGAAWSLAASIFPLLPEEVRRHANRKRRSSQPPGVMEASGDKLPRLSLLAFAAGLLSVAMLAAASRAPIVSLAVSGLALGAWTRWRRDDGVHLGIGVGVPVAGLLLAALTAGPFGAVRRFLALGSDESLSSRVLFWRASVDAWLESPVLGAGVGAWTQAVSPHERAPHLYDIMHAHSEPAELLVELGAVGLLAVTALLLLATRAVLRRLDVVEHDLRSASAVGLGVALLAVAMQCVADFPLRTPGVLVPAAVLLGVVLGTLDIGKPGGRRGPLAGLVSLGTLGTLIIGISDARAPGTRAERISDMAPLLSLESEDPQAAACAAAEREPSRAWAHAACAIATSRLAEGDNDAGRAHQADLAAARALRLMPRSPRLQVQMAAVMARLRAPTLLRDGFAERATALLMQAVSLDGWRAEEAFRIARKLGPGAVDRVGAAADTEPVSRARTLYQYGIVLEEEGRREEARKVQVEAALADPAFGPPHFRAGTLARAAGDDDEMQAHFRHFLAARDRPVGMEGWVLYHLDERDAAEVRFRRAVAVNRDNRWAWEGLAALAKDRVDPRSEVEALRRILEIDPAHVAAAARMKELGYE